MQLEQGQASTRCDGTYTYTTNLSAVKIKYKTPKLNNFWPIENIRDCIVANIPYVGATLILMAPNRQPVAYSHVGA